MIDTEEDGPLEQPPVFFAFEDQRKACVHGLAQIVVIRGQGGGIMHGGATAIAQAFTVCRCLKPKTEIPQTDEKPHEAERQIPLLDVEQFVANQRLAVAFR